MAIIVHIHLSLVVAFVLLSVPLQGENLQCGAMVNINIWLVLAVVDYVIVCLFSCR
jgi:hypothetical protein